jgi:hypothetical protein
VSPAAAFYSADLKEFILPYDAVRTAESPDDVLLAFAQSTYEAAANLAVGTAPPWRGPKGRPEVGYHGCFHGGRPDASIHAP